MIKKVLFFLVFSCLVFSTSVFFGAEDEKIVSSGRLIISVGDIKVVRTEKPRRVSIQNPTVADVTEVNTGEIVVAGKMKGVTELIFWDKAGKHKYEVKVIPVRVDYISRQVNEVLDSLDISEVYTKILKSQGKVLLLGKMRNLKQKDRLMKALGGLKDKVTDLVELKEKKIVEISAEIIEVNKGATDNLGFEWPGSITANEPAGRWGKLAGVPDALWRVADWDRGNQFSMTFEFLQQEGKARILSRPRVVCQSGKEAELVVGGEKPVFSKVVTGEGAVGGNVEYKEYGITLDIRPTVLDEEEIELDVNVEVEDLETVEEFEGVGRAYPILKRNTSTVLFLDDGETLIIGGLIKRKREVTTKKTPLLGDIPLLGNLFRKRNVDTGGGAEGKKSTELFITITPRIIHKEKDVFEEEPLRIADTSGPEPASDEQFSPLVKRYMQEIQKIIVNNISYPDILKETGWEGNLMLGVSIFSSGKLDEVEIVKSSGYSTFDKEALKLVKTLTFPSFPSGMESEKVKIRVPIIYQDR